MKYGDNRDCRVTVGEKKKHRPYIKAAVRVFNQWFPDTNTRVVDIGTRDGFAVKTLMRLGYEVLGTEIMPKFVAHAKKHGRNVICDDFMDSKLESSTFDAVFSRNVVEHCRDTGIFFEQLQRILKHGGGAFILFPLESKEKMNRIKTDWHLVNFDSLNAFKKYVDPEIWETLFLDMSNRAGCIKNQYEALFVGRLR